MRKLYGHLTKSAVIGTIIGVVSGVVLAIGPNTNMSQQELEENGEAGVANYVQSEKKVVVYRDAANQIHAMYLKDQEILKTDSRADSLSVSNGGDSNEGGLLNGGNIHTMNSYMAPVPME